MTVSGDDEADRVEGAPHPRHATRLVGQGEHERALLDAYRSGRLPHAIIFAGPAGIGKATLAWRLAKFLFENPRPGAAQLREAVDLSVRADSKSSAQVTSLSHPDLVLLRREINEKTKRFYAEIRADDVRRAIALFHRAAGAGGFRICIVDSAEELNRSSANALLKIIEEPPPNSLFLLIAHRPGLVLPTIRSRARLVTMNRLSAEEIIQVIDGLGPHGTGMEEETITSAARQARGSVREALNLLARRGTELNATLNQLLDRLPLVDWREVHMLADRVTSREDQEGYAMTLNAVFDWLAAVVSRDSGATPRRLAAYAEVWEKVSQAARETDALNLDRRPLILSIFSDLATAVRAAA